jgi:hypothetical protein
MQQRRLNTAVKYLTNLVAYLTLTPDLAANQAESVVELVSSLPPHTRPSVHVQPCYRATVVGKGSTEFTFEHMS